MKRAQYEQKSYNINLDFIRIVQYMCVAMIFFFFCLHYLLEFFFFKDMLQNISIFFVFLHVS